MAFLRQNSMFEDNYRQRGLRNKLVKQLRQKGIVDEKVLAAIGKVPRHFFFENALLEHAYQDKAFPIGEGQTISQPYTVARMTQLLRPFEGMKVLEIGTGSGYQAAVLCRIGCRVWSVERMPDLLNTARHRLERHGFTVATRLGDGTVGWNEFAPYDGIIVTAGAPKIPSPYMAQLSIGGKLIIPVGEKEVQTLFVVTRINEDDFDIEEEGEFRFVPLIGKRGWDE